MSPSEALVREIRAARPAAPDALRERVRTVAAQEPEREPWLRRLSLRRFVLVAAPAAAAVALAAAGVVGLTQDAARDVQSGAGDDATELPMREAAPVQEDDAPRSTPPAAGGAVAPAPGTLQRYDAQLHLRVDDVDQLSSATQSAMRIARSLGGGIVSVSYDAAPAGVGSAQLTLRVPVARAQEAVFRLSGLGTILGQRYGIEDLQRTADDLTRQLEETQARIADLQTQLESKDLTASERAVLRARLAEARRQLADVRAALESTRADARLATIHVSLTTEEIAAAPPAAPGALDRVFDILRWEALALLYVLVVVGPFALVALAVWYALRLRRRREESRLLAQQ